MGKILQKSQESLGWGTLSERLSTLAMERQSGTGKSQRFSHGPISKPTVTMGGTSTVSPSRRRADGYSVVRIPGGQTTDDEGY